jgi:quercetin dioxygenase-like cupin family protein
MYSDSNGESHFEDVDVALQETDFAPPARPFLASSFGPAARYGFISQPVGWIGNWHPSPYRLIAFVLSGIAEATVSDGEIRTFKPGDVLLHEDTTGKGHFSRNAGSTDMTAAMVQLPEEKHGD